MSWESQIAGIEASNYKTCTAIRAKYNLPPDPNEECDCCSEPCFGECPI